MRERVEGVGGTLRAGPEAEGFVVDATVPLHHHAHELSGARGPGGSPVPADADEELR
jgi:signal transduction histidine kinase